MQTALRKVTKTYHPVKRAKTHLKSAKKRVAKAAHAAGTLYSQSIKTIKKRPYKSAGVVLGLGVLSSVLLWYRFIK